MTDEAMSVVLMSDHLNIDEMEIIDAVREWATVNSVRIITHDNSAVYTVCSMYNHTYTLPTCILTKYNFVTELYNIQ